MAYIGNDVDSVFIPSSVNTSTSLTITGGALTQTGGDVNLDSGTLFVDESANRVGILTTTPGYALDVNGDINIPAATNLLINGTQISTADLTENASYLFYTDARSRAAISVTDSGGDGSLSYNSGTGVITYTGPSASEARAHFSVTDAGGDGSLSYDSGTGVFTYTGPSAAETQAHFSGGTGITLSSGTISIDNTDTNVLGGSLDGSLGTVTMAYLASAPSSPVQGQFYFNSLNQKAEIYTGSSFVDLVPSGGGGGGGAGTTDANATFRKYTYTLTSTTNAISGSSDTVVTAGSFVVGNVYTIKTVGTTDFTAIGASANTVGVEFTATGVGSGTGDAYDTLYYATGGIQNIEAYVNGVKAVEGSSNDYVATTGTSVNFTSNLASGDVVDIQVYELLTQDAFVLATGGTFTGNVGINTATINNRLHIHNTANDQGILFTQAGSNHSAIIGDANRTGADESILNIQANWNGTSSSRISLESGDDTTNKDDGRINFWTSEAGGSLQTRLSITPSGNTSLSQNLLIPLDKKIHLEGTSGDDLNAIWKANAENTVFITSRFNIANIIDSNNDDTTSYWSVRTDGTTLAGSSELMRVQSDGNVGIGTNNPSTELEVVATQPTIKSRATGNSTGKLALDSNRAADVSGGQILGQWNGNTVSRIDFRNGADGVNKDDGEIGFSTSANNSTPVERVRIDSTGYVGIGTNDPDRLLHLYTSEDNILVLESSDTLADINLVDTVGSTKIRGDGRALKIYTGGDASSDIAANSDQKVLIESDKFEVNGVAEAALFIDAIYTKETWSAGNNTLAGNDLGTWTLTGGTLTTSTTAANYYEVDQANLPHGLRAITWVGNASTSYLTSPLLDIAVLRTNRGITSPSETGNTSTRSVADSRLYLTALVAGQSHDTGGESLFIELSSDSGTSWQENAAIVWQDNDSGNSTTDTTWRKVTVDISEYATATGTFQIRFKGGGTGNGDSFGVSNIYIYEAPIPNRLQAKTLKLGTGALDNATNGDVYGDSEGLTIVSNTNTATHIVLTNATTPRLNSIGITSADELKYSADGNDEGNESKHRFYIDNVERAVFAVPGSSTSQSTYLQLIGHTSDRSNWRLTAKDDGTHGYFTISDYSGASWTDNLTVHESGNVGIGTTDPDYNLHIRAYNPILKLEGIGSSYVEGGILLETNSGNSNGYRGNGIYMYDRGAGREWYAGTPYNINDAYLIARVGSGVTAPAGATAQYTNALFTIRNSGNVGIGITIPASKLHVNGSIETTNGDLLINNGEIRIGITNNYQGIYFEDDNHAITWNDGQGNFNFRVGNNGISNENCTEAGFIFQDEWSQSSGWREFNISSASLAIGDAPTWRPQIEYNNNTTILRYQGSTRFTTTNAGGTITGTLTETSDINLKENIQNIESPLAKVKALRGVKFDWIANGETDYGLIAQEVEQVIPELVRTETIIENVNKIHEETEIKTLAYTSMIGVLVEAIKELSAEVEALKTQLSGS